jgi:aspartate-semialdehyde dehydrogenase
VERLAAQTAMLLNGRPVEVEGEEKQIAFNAIPHIDEFQPNGYTREEMKMVWETRKIFADESIGVNPTAVRIPAFIGHSEAVHIETREPISAPQVRELLAASPGIEVLNDDEMGGYPTAVTEASGTDPVYVGRIREDISHDRGIDLWVVADNVRKGAALNSVQIAEILVREYL